MFTRRVGLFLILLLISAAITVGDEAADAADENTVPVPAVVDDDPAEGEPADGESEVEEKPKARYHGDDFQFTFNAGVGVNRYQWIFSGALHIDFNANPVLGIGFRTTFDYGLKYDNFNLNGYILFKFWWFYFGPGVSFQLQGMTLPSDDPEYVAVYPYDPVASLALTAGARVPVARIGPGFLTIDLSVDWYQTDILLTVPSPPLSGQMLDELINGSIYAFSFSARIGYTF